MRRLGVNQDGATAVEFAMVLPAFILLIVGGFYAAEMMHAAASMQYAVQAAARCAAVNTTVCTDSSSTVNYATSHATALGAGAVNFTSSTSTCGHVVTGTLTYALDTGLGKIDVPLSATACFP